jgi:hypothetical protein
MGVLRRPAGPASAARRGAERAQLAQAAGLLCGRGDRTGVVDRRLAAGVQSRVWRIVTSGPDGRSDHVVKWFRAGYRAGNSVAAEFAALVALDRAVADLRPAAYRVRCPRPVRAWDWGYAMSTVSGCRLDLARARRLLPAEDERLLADDLVAALSAFHAVHRGPYGDFHAGNVLLGADREVYLIDPGPANPGFFSWPGPVSPPPLAVDLAYWTFAAAATAHRRPRAAGHALRLAGALRDAATELMSDPGLAAEVDRCLADYWKRLASQGLRQRAVAVAATRLARLRWDG